MDEDDIYGSILSDPKSASHSSYSNSNVATSNSYSEHYTNANEHNSHYPPQHTGPGMSTPTPWLFISNLTWWTNEDDLRSLLGENFGNRILTVHFIEHKPNGKSKGMAIVEFGDVDTAETAKDRIEGKEIYGRKCEVGFARNPPIKPFEKNPNYQRGGGNSGNFRPPIPSHQYSSQHQTQHHPIQSQYQRTRPVEYEVEHNATESSRHVYREDPGNVSGQYTDGHRSSTRHSRDHYRDSREHYHREGRTRSRSPDRRPSHRH